MTAITRVRCVAAFLAAFGFTATSHGQSLDQAVQRMLQADCFAMGGENPAFGADLNAICTMSFGSARGNANSGGGGASSQTTAVSVENRRRSQLQDESATLVRPWGLYVNATGESLDRKRTAFADGFDSTLGAVTVGADYRMGTHWITGLALAYRTNSGDFEGGGDFDTDSYGATLYASFAPNSKMFIDASVAYASKSHAVSRHANFVEFDNGGNTNTFDGLVGSDTDGAESGAHLQFGYDFQLGRFTVGPRVGANWLRTEVDAYSETGGGSGQQVQNGKKGAAGLALVYPDQEADSLQGVVGAFGSMSFSPSFGVLVAQANVDYIHEFDNDQRFVNVRFVQDGRPSPQYFQFQTDVPERDFFKVGISFVTVLSGGMQPFLTLQGMVGNEQFDDYSATLGIRFEL